MEEPHTPREKLRKKPKTPHFAVVPERSRHCLPPLDISTPVSLTNGFDEKTDAASALSSFSSLLISNFDKIHSQHALILTMLQGREASPAPSARSAGLPSPAHSSIISKMPAALKKEMFSDATKALTSLRCSSVGNLNETNKRQSNVDNRQSLKKVATKESIETEASYESRDNGNGKAEFQVNDNLGTNEGAGVTYASEDSGDSATFRLGSKLRQSKQNFILMEKLAKIVQKHSKTYQRNPHAVAHRVWQFLENPTSSRWSYAYASYFCPLVLLASVYISFSQTEENYGPLLEEASIGVIQFTLELWFALEIIMRFLVSPDKVKFWISLYNLIDFVSAAPLIWRVSVWLFEFKEEGSVYNILVGVVPMLRLLKVLRRFHKFQLLLSAFGMALEALPVLIFALAIIAISFSGLIYVLEARDLIASMPMSLWFVVVTMTTVGYGDVVPETFAGKSIAVMLMITSALYMAMPIGIVGHAFSEVWADRDRLLLIAILRESFSLSGVSRQLIREIFEQILEDEKRHTAEPEIGFTEFIKMMRALQIDVSDERLMVLFCALDVDGGGTVSCDEFIQTLFPQFFQIPTASTKISGVLGIGRSNSNSLTIRQTQLMFQQAASIPKFDYSQIGKFANESDGTDDTAKGTAKS